MFNSAIFLSVSFCRFLLVGQTMPSILDEELSKEGVDTLSSRPFRNAGRQGGRQLSLCGTPEKSSYRQMSMSDRSSIRVEEIIPAARVAIQVCVWVSTLLYGFCGQVVKTFNISASLWLCLCFFCCSGHRQWRWGTLLLQWPASCAWHGLLPLADWTSWAAASQLGRPQILSCLSESVAGLAAQVRHRPTWSLLCTSNDEHKPRPRPVSIKCIIAHSLIFRVLLSSTYCC